MSVNRHESELAENHAARLTAYALGQLEGHERAEVERELDASPIARQTVESIRALADHLVEATRADSSGGPSASMRAAILRRLDELEVAEAASPRARRTFGHGVRLLVALAACLLIAAFAVAWLTWLGRQPGGGALALFRPAPDAPSVAVAPSAPLAEEAAEAISATSPAAARPVPETMADEALDREGAAADRASAPDVRLVPSAHPMAAPGTSLAAKRQANTIEEPLRAEAAGEQVKTFAAPPEPQAGKLAAGAPGVVAAIEGVGVPAAEAAAPALAAPPAAAALPAGSPASAAPSEKALSTSRAFSGGADKPPESGAMPKGRTWGPGWPGPPGNGMPGMPGGAGKSRLADHEDAKAEAQGLKEASGGPLERRVSALQAPAGRSDALRSTEMGQPVGGAVPGHPGMLGGHPGMPPVYAGMPAGARRAGQAAMASRGTAAVGPLSPPYARGLAADASLGLQQRIPLEVESARGAGRQRQSTESDSAVATDTPSFRKGEVPAIIEHPFVEVGPFPMSPLPLEVDRTQYPMLAAEVAAGRWPRPQTVDVHGLINAFPYRDPAPPAQGALAVTLEAAECPWRPGHRLVRVAVACADLRAGPPPQAVAPKTRDAAPMRPSAAPVAAEAAAGKSSPKAPAPAVARDVRIVVEFNPLQAAAYRLIGVDIPAAGAPAEAEGPISAAVLREGERVVGLYQVIPPGAANVGQFPQQLRYQYPGRSAGNLTKDAYSGQLLTVHVQYREAATGKLQQAEFALRGASKPFAEASPDLRFAAAVAAFGMLLRHSPYAGSATLDWVEKTAAQAARDAPAEPRTQFVELVRQLRRIPAH